MLMDVSENNMVSHLKQVYLDYSASTPVDERVVAAMQPHFGEIYGNTTSSHQYGRRAETAVEDAREKVARIFNCKPNEVVFTGCGSESDNLAIRGAAWAARRDGRGNHLMTTPVEHSAVGKTVNTLATVMGFEKTILPVDEMGMVDGDTVADACREDSILASVIYANNEVGTVAPLADIAARVHERDVLLHTDAVQAAGQLSLDVVALGVDMMSISAHKFYGPKGVGALYVRDGIELVSSLTGGSHEAGRRAGTLNTPLIVGLAEALQLAYDEQEERVDHYRAMCGELVESVLTRVPDVVLSGHPEKRLPSHASFVIDGVDSARLLMHLDMRGVAASGGSACKTGNPEPSDVLLAMGYPPERAVGGLRMTVGRFTTLEAITYAVDVLVDAVEKVRNLNRVVL